jgi:hypothetical protein
MDTAISFPDCDESYAVCDEEPPLFSNPGAATSFSGWPTKNAGLFKPEKFRNIFKETTCHGLFHVSKR